MALFKTGTALNEMVQLQVPAGDFDANYVCVDLQLDGATVLEIFGVNWGFSTLVPGNVNVNLFSCVYVCLDAIFDNKVFTSLVPFAPFPAPDILGKLIFSSVASFATFLVAGAEILIPTVMRYEDFGVPLRFPPAHRITAFASVPIVQNGVPQFDYVINLMVRGATVPSGSYSYGSSAQGYTTR